MPWTLGILGFMAATLLIFGLFGIPLWFVALFVLLEVLTRRTLTQQRALLGALAVSAERSIPLVPTLEAFARETGGRLARRARQLADMLVAGTPLTAALIATRRLLPRAVLPLIYVGSRSNALTPALRRAADAQQLPQPVWEAVMGRCMYLCCVLAMAAGVVAFMFVKIIPLFIKIFKDFGADFPPMTQLLVNAARWFWPFEFIGGLLPLLVVAVAFYAMLRFTGVIEWDLPGLGWLLRRLDTAVLFESLALVAEQRQPLPQAVECLAFSYPKADIRRRLGQAFDEISAGRDWCESFLTHGPAAAGRPGGSPSRRARGKSPLGTPRDGRQQPPPARVSPAHAGATAVPGGDPRVGVGRMVRCRGVLHAAAFAHLQVDLTMKRRGITILETIVAGVLLAATMTVCLQILGAHAAQQRAMRQRETAVREAANVMERTAAVHVGELTPEHLAEFQLAPEAAAALPEGELSVAVADVAGDVAARRITVSIRWQDRNGDWVNPVQLTAWRTRP